MKELTLLFKSIFAAKAIKPATVQTALEPLHEKDMDQGGEFLDDFSSLDDQQDDQLVAPSE